MRRRLALVLAPLVLTSLLLAGCGDDGGGDDDASPSTTTEATTTTGDDEPGDEPGSTGTTEDDGGTETTDGSATTDASGTTEASGGGQPFCTSFRDLNESFSGTPDSTLEDLQEGAATFADESAAIVDEAPAELTDHMQVLADFFADLRDAVAEATTKEEAEAAAQELNSDEINEAGNAITTWIGENCPPAA